MGSYALLPLQHDRQAEHIVADIAFLQRFAFSGVIFQPELQVETISTRLEPLPFMEFSKALRIAFLALRIAGTDCTD